MRRWLIWTCVGCLTATAVAPRLCAQNNNRRTTQSNAPTADRFVSSPGQMVSTPGQMVTGPGQMVTTPGQMVIPPGRTVIPMGSSIAPTPGVITPFTNQSRSFTNTSQPTNETQSGKEVTPGRNYHNRHTYRPGYGAVEGYALPYVVNRDLGAEAAVTEGAGSSPGSTTGRSMMGVSKPHEQTSSLDAAPMKHGPPYRPEYRPDESGQAKAASSPNVIQSREPALTIVMKNGSKKKVRNYALTQQALIDLDGAASGKEVNIPLSEINVPATQKAAAKTGMSFSVPEI